MASIRLLVFAFGTNVFRLGLRVSWGNAKIRPASGDKAEVPESALDAVVPAAWRCSQQCAVFSHIHKTFNGFLKLARNKVIEPRECLLFRFA